MEIVFFVQSLISDWNHGNAHFLRGLVTELGRRGHSVSVFEPRGSWSLTNLIEDHGERVIKNFENYFPSLSSTRYDPEKLDLDKVLDGANLVVVHEWNEPELVARIGRHRALNTGYRLLFHDTHHRSITLPEQMQSYDLSQYDGVLAFGEVIRSIYLNRSWASRAWTFHEGADTVIFKPLEGKGRGDIVWIGNWGDEERSSELREFLFEPVKALGCIGRVYGVRYPEGALNMLQSCGIEYGGWVPNYMVPQVFSDYRVTVHVPRRPYVRDLPGIPTIRVFEALACGIPLVCSPWDDCEKLFSAGEDYLSAQNGLQMKENIKMLLNDREYASKLALHGRRTVLERHTCGHRANQLIGICKELGIGS